MLNSDPNNPNANFTYENIKSCLEEKNPLQKVDIEQDISLFQLVDWFNELSYLLKEHGISLYFVGTCIMDHIKKNDPCDYDLMLVNENNLEIDEIIEGFDFIKCKYKNNLFQRPAGVNLKIDLSVYSSWDEFKPDFLHSALLYSNEEGLFIKKKYNKNKKHYFDHLTENLQNMLDGKLWLFHIKEPISNISLLRAAHFLSVHNMHVDENTTDLLRNYSPNLLKLEITYLINKMTSYLKTSNENQKFKFWKWLGKFNVITTLLEIDINYEQLLKDSDELIQLLKISDSPYDALLNLYCHASHAGISEFDVFLPFIGKMENGHDYLIHKFLASNLSSKNSLLINMQEGHKLFLAAAYAVKFNFEISKELIDQINIQSFVISNMERKKIIASLQTCLNAIYDDQLEQLKNVLSIWGVLDYCAKEVPNIENYFTVTNEISIIEISTEKVNENLNSDNFETVEIPKSENSQGTILPISNTNFTLTGDSQKKSANIPLINKDASADNKRKRQPKKNKPSKNATKPGKPNKKKNQTRNDYVDTQSEGMPSVGKQNDSNYISEFTRGFFQKKLSNPFDNVTNPRGFNRTSEPLSLEEIKKKIKNGKRNPKNQQLKTNFKQVLMLMLICGVSVFSIYLFYCSFFSANEGTTVGLPELPENPIDHTFILENAPNTDDLVNELIPCQPTEVFRSAIDILNTHLKDYVLKGIEDIVYRNQIMDSIHDALKGKIPNEKIFDGLRDFLAQIFEKLLTLYAENKQSLGYGTLQVNPRYTATENGCEFDYSLNYRPQSTHPH